MRSLLLQLTFSVGRTVRGCVLVRPFSSKVPDKPTWFWKKSEREVPELDNEMIEHLERLSLVEFNNKQGVERLRSAIEYANMLHHVTTEGVEPMYSVLEDRALLLREDLVKDGGCKKEILKNASKIEEDYFVAPPGNIPLGRKNGS